MWVEDPEDLNAMFPENSMVSPSASLFMQPDDVDTSKVAEAPFELPQIAQATIQQMVNAVTEPEIVLLMQEVLDMLE